jgi:hypothetical protein
MARGHSAATVVIDATDQQGIGFGACDRVIVALVVELGLRRVKEITIEDGWLLAGEDPALEDDLADVEPIAQKMGERAAGEWDAANRAPGLERTHLGDDPRSRRSAINRLRLPSSRHRSRQPPHGGGCIELLGDRDEGYAMAIEQLDELGEVRQRAGQAVDLVNDDHIDLSGFHVG